MAAPGVSITADPQTGGGSLDLRAKVTAKRFALSLLVVAHEPSRLCKGGVEEDEELRIIMTLANHHHAFVEGSDDTFAFRQRT